VTAYEAEISSQGKSDTGFSHTARKRVNASDKIYQEAGKLTTFSEKIINDLAGLITDSRASQRVQLEYTPRTSVGQPISTIGLVLPQDQQYNACLAILMGLYKDEKIAKVVGKAIIKALETNPMSNITFLGITNNLREDWIAEAIKSQ